MGGVECRYRIVSLYILVTQLLFNLTLLWVLFLNLPYPVRPLFSLLQSNMKNMEQELLCPVCDEIVKQPILLPCQHSVCLLCAAEVLVQRGYPPPDLPPEPNSPASTPNTRSPRQARRPVPRTPDRLERVLGAGGGQSFFVRPCGFEIPTSLVASFAQMWEKETTDLSIQKSDTVM